MTEDKYEVEFSDGTKEYINEQLAEMRDLTDRDLDKIAKLWKIRYVLERTMKDLSIEDDKESLVALFAGWRENEFELQEVWGFGRNADYHRDFDLPHCTCPKLDNEDYLGTGYRVVTAGCIYHGRGEKDGG